MKAIGFLLIIQLRIVFCLITKVRNKSIKIIVLGNIFIYIIIYCLHPKYALEMFFVFCLTLNFVKIKGQIAL